MADPSASLVEQAIANYRGELLRLDAAALQRVADLYEREVRAVLAPRIAALEAELLKRGTLTVADAMRLNRARELLAQTEDALARIVPRIEGVVGDYRQLALELAADHAHGLAVVSAAQGGSGVAADVATSWTRLNTGAVEQILGRLTTGSPLSRLLNEIGGSAGDRIAAKLREQIALGSHPRSVAAALAREVNVPESRLLLIARTEALNSYRGASAAAYAENGDILDGMIWTCAKSDLTCAACLSMDGTLYPLGASFNRFHPACRCSMRPSLKGIDNQTLPTGREWFYAQPLQAQLKAIPASAHAEFSAGLLDLSDFVKVDRTEEWGESHRVGGVAYARDQARKRTGGLSSRAASDGRDRGGPFGLGPITRSRPADPRLLPLPRTDDAA